MGRAMAMAAIQSWARRFLQQALARQAPEATPEPERMKMK